MNTQNINSLLQEIADLLRQRDTEIMLERLAQEKELEDREFAEWVAHMESKYSPLINEDY